MKQYRVGLAYLLILLGVLAGAVAGNQITAVLSESARIDSSRCIIIDPGHGGVDGGATSCTGKLESNMNLEISLRLNDLLHFLGYRTVMIRTTDISVYTQGETIFQKKISDLKERVRIVNETKNGLLVSIHQNVFADSKYYGAQVFYSEQEGSKELAEQMQNRFVETLNPGSNRKCKRATGIYLMEHIDCTGVLVECGFLSNPEEEARLRSKEYQNKICCVIASSLCNYLDHAEIR